MFLEKMRQVKQFGGVLLVLHKVVGEMIEFKCGFEDSS